MRNKKPPDSVERSVVFLALKATERSDVETCPSDERLAAFISNRLEGEERQAVLRHLNRCSQCYRHWLEAASYLIDAKESTSEIKPAPSSPVWHHIMMWFTPWKLAVPTAALVALACLAILWPHALNMNAEIDQGYTAITLQDSASLANIAQELPLPWDKAVWGFSESRLTPAKQAFGAGLWKGSSALMGKDSIEPALPEFLSPSDDLAWPDTEWAGYYELGRWTVLLWALAQSEQPGQDWNQQQRILQALQATLEKHPASEAEAKQAMAALERIEERLTEAQHRTDPASLTELRRTLETIMQQLF